MVIERIVQNAKSISKIKQLITEIMKTGKADMAPFWKFTRKTKGHQIVNAVFTEEGERLEDKEIILQEFRKHYTTTEDKRGRNPRGKRMRRSGE